MICGRIFFNLFARTFENILYNTLHKLMGRNSDTSSGFLTFGIKVMKVWFRCSGKEAEFKKDRTKVVIPYPPSPNSVDKRGVACHPVRVPLVEPSD